MPQPMRDTGPPLSGFDRTYVVNLKERRDRRRATRRELGRLGVGPAGIAWFDAVRPDDPHGFPSVGAHGCFRSHLGVLRDAATAGLTSVLVLEDDIMAMPALTEDWPVVRHDLARQSWDIAMFGFTKAVERVPSVPGGLVRVQEPVETAHCYAVRGSILERLVSFLEAVRSREPGHPLGGPMHYDGALNVFCAQNPEVVRVRSERVLVGQRPSRSDIAELKWYDRGIGMRTVSNVARDVKASLK